MGITCSKLDGRSLEERARAAAALHGNAAVFVDAMEAGSSPWIAMEMAEWSDEPTTPAASTAPTSSSSTRSSTTATTTIAKGNNNHKRSSPEEADDSNAARSDCLDDTDLVILGGQQQQPHHRHRPQKGAATKTTLATSSSSYHPKTRSLIRTGSIQKLQRNGSGVRRGLVHMLLPSPASPTCRASTYNHVHSAVALNFATARSAHKRFQQHHNRKNSLRGGGANHSLASLPPPVLHEQDIDKDSGTKISKNYHRRNGKKPSLTTRTLASTPSSSSSSSSLGSNKSYSSNASTIAEGGRPLGLVGLRNLGNTCFMNSSLQCLSQTIPLTDYFLGYDYKREINRTNKLGTGGRLAVAYAQLVKSLWLHKTPTQVLAPTAFRQQLQKFAPQFAGNRQHDAQELLACLLDGIHEDLNRIHEKPYIELKDCDGTNDERDAIEAWRNHLRRDKSLIVDIFQGQLRQTLQCLQCKHTNRRFEPFMYLSLPIDDSCRTLQDCLDLYLATEQLDGVNQWYCPKCKCHQDATKKSDLWVLPPILIIHLKRFRVNDFGQVRAKNDAPICYPTEQWDLSESVCRNTSQGDNNDGGAGYRPSDVYDLYAVSNHIGGLGAGHYTAYGLNRFDEQWYHFNDSMVSPIDPSTLQQRSAHSSAYVLFYNRSHSSFVVPHQQRSSVPKRNAPPRFVSKRDDEIRTQHQQQPHGDDDEEDENDSGHVVNDGNENSWLVDLGVARAPLIRRQSVSRPELWPHAQVQGRHFRGFARISMRVSSSAEDDEDEDNDDKQQQPQAHVIVDDHSSGKDSSEQPHEQDTQAKNASWAHAYDEIEVETI